jgi:translation initiation factor IF-2
VANLIIKADVQSSLEAIDQALKTIRSEEVEYKVTGYGVGTIGDNDIKNARAAKATVIGFHVGIDSSTKQLAERGGIHVRTFEIIYELAGAVRLIMADLLDPEIRRIPLGKLKILAIFKNNGKSQIVGGKVTQGKLIRGAIIDVLRDGATLVTGRLGQLQHNKTDVAEVSEGLEAGIRFDMQSQPAPQQLIKEGDVLEIYEEEKIKRTI